MKPIYFRPSIRGPWHSIYNDRLGLHTSKRKKSSIGFSTNREGTFFATKCKKVYKKDAYIYIHIHVICTIEFWICMHNLFIFIYIKFTIFCSYFTVHISRKKEHHENYQPTAPASNRKCLSKPLEKNLVAGLTLVFLKAETIEPKEASKN